MLVLGAKLGEFIRLKTAGGETVDIFYFGLRRDGGIRLAFDAPKSVAILRECLLPEGERIAVHERLAKTD